MPGADVSTERSRRRTPAPHRRRIEHQARRLPKRSGDRSASASPRCRPSASAIRRPDRSCRRRPLFGQAPGPQLRRRAWRAGCWRQRVEAGGVVEQNISLRPRAGGIDNHSRFKGCDPRAASRGHGVGSPPAPGRPPERLIAALVSDPDCGRDGERRRTQQQAVPARHVVRVPSPKSGGLLASRTGKSGSPFTGSAGKLTGGACKSGGLFTGRVRQMPKPFRRPSRQAPTPCRRELPLRRSCDAVSRVVLEARPAAIAASCRPAPCLGPSRPP